MPNVIPPAPNAANMGKFIETPVSTYTGLPEIGVPIWTVEAGGYKLPISVNYHSGGIKLAEIASWVGLGWNLNAGGMITRSAVGPPDETLNYGYLDFKKGHSRFDDSDISFANGAAVGNFDTQPDIFYYNFGNYSGRFVFNDQGDVVTTPEKKIKIKRGNRATFNFNDLGSGIGLSAPSIADWEITTEDGIKYTFSACERTESLSLILDDPNASPPGQQNYVSSWYLTSITLLNGSTISFTYSDYIYNYDLSLSKEKYTAIPGVPSGSHASPTTSSRQYIGGKRLSTIEYAGGKVRFIPTAASRADLIGDYALDKIVVENTAGQVIKQWQFQYQYLIGNTLVPPNQVSVDNSEKNWYIEKVSYHYAPAFSRRLMLTKIVEQDKNGQGINNGYGFDYHHDLGLANRCFPLMDHWGYANQPEAIGPQDVKIIAVKDSQTSQLSYVVDGKAPVINYAKQGTLNMVTYPTGGTARYEYEANECNFNIPGMNLAVSHQDAVALSISHSSYNHFDYDHDYVTRTWKNQTNKHFYVDFSVNTLPGQNINTTVKIQNMPYTVEETIGYYIVNVNDDNPQHALWLGVHDGSYPISLPNGNYRLYTYVSNSLLQHPESPSYTILYSAYITGWDIVYDNRISPNTYPSGGLRVKQTTLKDLNSTLINKYTYKNVDGESSGYAVSFPSYFYYYGEQDQSGGGSGDLFYLVFSSSSCYPLSTTQGVYAGYNFVTRQQTDTLGNALGKTEYSYSSPKSDPDLYPTTPYGLDFYTSRNTVLGSGGFGQPRSFPYGGTYIQTIENAGLTTNKMPFAPTDNRDWLRGVLISQIDYKVQNGNYYPVKKLSNYYSKIFNTPVKGHKYKIYYPQGPGVSVGIVHNEYSISSGHRQLDSTLIEDFSSPQVIKSLEKFEYNASNLLPSKTSVQLSDSSVKKVINRYPQDMVSLSRDPNGTYQQMIADNIITPIIEEVRYKSNGVTDSQISLMRTNYNKYYSHLYLPGTIEIQSSALNPVETRLRYYAYDSQGNPQSVSLENGVKVCYVWSYNGQYPIAEIKNADYSSVVSALGGEAAVATFSAKPSPITTEVNSFLANLRTSLPNAQVTTFMYEPLVGLVSQTDAKGQTTYYEYDEFQRLKNVKDQNGNILKNNVYHYKP
ncbi:hypothetical protein DBR11_19085 [Pedobacter sp. HMWF019]|nr:hypothetical protein DBR11_19085 [Pedobacter sp. HMWF019]